LTVHQQLGTFGITHTNERNARHAGW